MQEPIEITGPVTLTVHMSTSVAHTDITGALVDVHPDGRAELVTEASCGHGTADPADHRAPLTLQAE